MSSGRGTSLSRVLRFILFPGIALAIAIPTFFVTDTMEMNVTASAQPAIVAIEATDVPEPPALVAVVPPESTSTRVETIATAPIAASASDVPVVANPATLPASKTPTSAPSSSSTSTSTALPAASSTSTTVAASTATSAPLPVVQLTDVPLVPTESPAEPNAPISRLVIPAIGVDAAVETKSVNPDGAMQNPGGPAVVSWYDFSSQPQGDGNAVFAGHLDYAGYGPAVFWDLGALAAGDLIEVHQQDGSIAQYRVTDVRPFAATDDASVVVSSQGRPTITLITCNGTFDSSQRAYDQRLVVTGDRID